MKKSLFILFVLLYSQYMSAQKFEDLDLYRLDFSAGINTSYIQNKSMESYFDTYNKNNFANPDDGFTNLRMLSGYELGVKWNYLSLHYGQHTKSQWRDISNGVQRQFRLINNYVNVLASFEIGKSKTKISFGMNAYYSKFIAQVIYPNGEISRGLDYNLNGTYKGWALNGALRIEKGLGSNDKKFFSLYCQFTGPVAGTASDYNDFNSGKGALNTGNNAITRLDFKSEFRGLIFGLNYNFRNKTDKK